MHNSEGTVSKHLNIEEVKGHNPVGAAAGGSGVGEDMDCEKQNGSDPACNAQKCLSCVEWAGETDLSR